MSATSPAAPGPHPTPMPGGWPMQVSPFAILTVTAIYLGLHWTDIPARFPVRWDGSGQPIGWSVRTLFGVYEPLLFGACLMMVAAASSYGALHFGRPGREEPLVRSTAGDFAREMGVFLLAVEFFLAVIFSFVGLLPLMGNHDPGMTPLLIATVAMFVALVFAMSRLAKHHAEHGDDVHARAASATGVAVNSHWKGGVFYVNRDDAALFVPKRFGVGYTLNFGHASAWVIMALTVLLPILLVLVAMHRS